MALYKFRPSDVFYSRIKAHQKCEFFINDGNVYYNRKQHVSGAFTSSVPAVKPGDLSVFELNIDRSLDHSAIFGDTDNDGSNDSQLIYPFIVKDGSLIAFKNISDSEYNTKFLPGDTITGSSPVNARISRKLFSVASEYNATASKPEEVYLRHEIRALKNTMNSYGTLSKHYLYIFPPDLEQKRGTGEDEFGNTRRDIHSVQQNAYGWDKEQQAINLISIPSIFYGSAIQKGTVSLKYYITGSLIGELRDEKQNGELVQVAPTGSLNSGSTAGVILYNEGFILLTGSWGIGANAAGALVQPQVKFGSVAVDNSWLYFAYGANDGNNSADDENLNQGTTSPASASFDISFNGTTYVPTVTMFAHAPKARLNTSTNPTYRQAGQTIDPLVHRIRYNERQNLKIKNTTSSSYPDPTGSFAKQTFITKVGVYDENKNLIAVASVANPVKKLEDLAYTFKIKMDI